VGELQQLKNSCPGSARYVSSELTNDVLLAANGTECAVPTRVSAGVASLANGERI
jgi:hypothetical protein